MKNERLDDRSPFDDPAGSFAQPADVLEDPGYSPAQKAAILKRWLFEEESLANAAQEGMSPELHAPQHATRLQEVVQALESLRESQADQP